MSGQKKESMKNIYDGALYRVSKFQRTQNGNGVILYAWAADNDNQRFKNVKIYIPFQSALDSEKLNKTASAVLGESKKSGKKYAKIIVPVERVPQPKNETPKDFDDAEVPFD